jgi:serine/threonine protein kinase
MVEEARKNPRLIGGVYQVGQAITSSPILTTYTAYNRNTSDVVGLLVFELPPTFEAEAALRLLEPLERRRLVQSPHLMHVYDWGIDGSRAYIATDPPRGISLRQVLDSETIDLPRAVEMAKQMARGLMALQAQDIENTDMRPQLITVDVVGDTDRLQLDDVDYVCCSNKWATYITSKMTKSVFLIRVMCPLNLFKVGRLAPGAMSIK